MLCVLSSVHLEPCDVLTSLLANHILFGTSFKSFVCETEGDFVSCLFLVKLFYFLLALPVCLVVEIKM